MSRTVPKADEWSRLNGLESRVANVERQKPVTASANFGAITPSAFSAVLLNATIGTSGDALVICSGIFVLPAGSTPNLSIALTIDSTTLGDGEEVFYAAPGAVTGSWQMNTAGEAQLLSDLFGAPVTPGPHVFRACSLGGTSGASALAFRASIIPL